MDVPFVDLPGLRRATAADCRLLWEWRNHPVVRHASRQPEPIPYEMHQAWFSESLGQPGRIILIGERAGEPMGVLRYDVQAGQAADRAETSIYLAPQKIGQGEGALLLRAGIQWMQMQMPQLQVLYAEILPENRPSARVFEKAGYRLCVPQSTQEAILRDELLRYERVL